MTKNSKFADASVLGLAGFVVAQALLNIPNAHLVPAEATPLFLTAAFFCGGLIQLIVGVFEFLKGNTFGTVVFGIYGSFFCSLALFIYFMLNGVLKFGTATGAALGTFLLVWSIFTLPVMIVSFKERKLLGWLFLFVELAFLGGAFSNLAGINSAIGGWCGIISAGIGLYMVTESLLRAVAPGQVHEVKHMTMEA